MEVTAARKWAESIFSSAKLGDSRRITRLIESAEMIAEHWKDIGIQADVLLCRTERQPLPDNERKKVALFTNVEESAIISGVDVDNIYKIPRRLHEQGLDEIVARKLHLDVPKLFLKNTIISLGSEADA